MKKLMTLIGAAAMAFGLHADPLLTGVGFDTLTADTALDTSGDYWTEWTAAEGEALTVKGWEASGESYSAECGRPTLPEGDGGAVNFLNVKTAFANPVYRNINADGAAQSIGDGLYFDQLVKFTACDEDPTEEYAGGKLVVYTKEIVDANDEVTDTRLCVKAGKYNGSELGSAVYDCGSIADGWHRVTIKAIDGVYNEVNAGFALYIDGAPKAYVEGNTGYDNSKLSALGKALNTAKKLFPSLVGSVSALAGVGFAGQGMVDDVALTDQAPEFAQDQFFYLNWDENVTALSYTVNGGASVPADVTPGEAGSLSILYTGAMDVNVDATYAENWGKGDWTADDGVTVDGTTFRVQAGDQAGYVVSADATPRLAVTIGEGEAVTYPSFAKALKAINAQGEDAKIVLNQDIELELISDDAGEHTEALIMSEGAVTIDLNGKTITGPADYVGNVIESSSALTIIDSSEDGSGVVLPAGENTGAVWVLENLLTVTGGTFEGAVVVEDGTSLVSGGAFLKGEEETFPLTVAEGYVVDDGETGYWIVSEAPKATVAFSAPHAEIAGVEAGEEVAADNVLTFTVEPNTGYDLAEENAVVVNGATLTPVDDTYTYTVTADDVELGTVTITVNTTAIEYTITYTDGDQSFQSDSYTVENYSEKEFWDGKRDGFTFVPPWMDEYGNEIEGTLAQFLAGVIVEEPRAVEIVGNWEEASYSVTWDASTANATVEATVDGLPINSGDKFEAETEIEFTVTPIENYEYATAPEDWELEGDGTITKTVTVGKEDVVVAIPAATEKSGLKPGETMGIGEGSLTPEQAQAEADKITVALTQDDLDAGLTADKVHAKAKFVGGAWLAEPELKDEFAPVVDATAAITVSTESLGVTVQNPVKGAYYGFVAKDSLDAAGDFVPVGTFTRATDTEPLELSAPKGEGPACFYKLSAALRDPME